MKYPDLHQIRQEFDHSHVEDIPAAVNAELAALDLGARCKPGQTIAITAGSRGIANIPEILRSIVDEMKKIGLEPFVVPAMGSHGGGVAEGQKKILEKYGITEETLGAPVRAGMDVVHLGESEDGVGVVIDKIASEADWVAGVNRVKPHTKFTGEIESGLCKMILIGLGKAEGAKIYHRSAVQYSFEHVAKTAIPIFLEKTSVLFGLGIVENAYDQTARLTATTSDDLVEKDKELLVDAKQRMPRLPFDELDVVVVDEMGKNYSGTGMDTNIVGWKSGVNATRVYVRDISAPSGGNAAGVGYADMVHRRLIDKMNAKATYLNCLTANSFDAGRIPITFETDKEAIEAALNTIGFTSPEQARLCWIPNTLELGEVWLSEALMGEVESRSDLGRMNGPEPIRFDDTGDFIPCSGMFENGH